MTLPVLVVSGFLGAGKTTLINKLLLAATGRRIAAIVNDFGAINIDAELIAERSETVLSLSNGCICCSLQGDLLRTLKLITDSADPPEQVVIEASGIADPQGIIATLMDPTLWSSVVLDAVLTVVDAEDCMTTQGRMEDPIWRAQVDSADLLILTKTGVGDLDTLLALLGKLSTVPVLLSDDVPLSPDLIFAYNLGDRSRPVRPALHAERFISLEVESIQPAILSDFQQAMEEIAPDLLRAKGFMTFRELPNRTLLFQLVGRRATLVPQHTNSSGCRLVLIGERPGFSAGKVAQRLLSALPGMVAHED